MQKTCALCRTGFEVTDADLAFYAKIAPVFGGKKCDFPAPTHCPSCRMLRRMSFRNERHLYRRKCDVTGQEIISVFAPDAPFKVCEKNRWYSDDFDPLAYGRPYDFSVPFFKQFRNLLLDMPLPSLRVELSENCEFNSDMRECKNCYLCARTHQSQNMLYTYRGNRSSDCVDCTQVTKSSFLYECVECVSCTDSRFLFFCSDCATSAFLLDCRNCMDCFMCCNLRGKRYCFLNEQLTKQQYEEKLEGFDFGSWQMVLLAQQMYRDIRTKAIRRNLLNVQCEDVTGDNLFHCKHCYDCYGVQESQDCRYVWDVKLYKDAMDAYSGGRDSELIYETTAGASSYDVSFCVRTSGCQHVRYSLFTNSSKHVFGSVGLRHATHCILNKEYRKDEYEALMPKIVEHMRTTGEWGEFFPSSCALFPYNDTVAQEYFPLTEERAHALGYRWQLEEERSAKEQAYGIPDTIDQVRDDVTKETLCCETCRHNYKIVPLELAFYRDRKIPLPHHCPDCRHAVRFSCKNPPSVHPSRCSNCGAPMVTSYPEDTDMRIVCESCYLKEVY
jgi:hypothetical protein